ncbi:MAG: ribosome maturation factor RimP [Actinomycetia bacterium]|nr:ribosome maturation factor RimP [Actinomycetes bacterium]
MSAVADRVERALAPVVAAEGFDLEAVEVQPAGRRRLIRVLVDRDGGVTLDDIASLTLILSVELDETNAMGEQPYVLEVSSPGVGRPLTLPRHWRRNATRLVRVTTTEGDEIVGRIVVSDEVVVTLEPAGGRPGDQSDGLTETKALTFAEISEAHVEVEFRRSAAPSDDTSAEGEL